MKLLSIFLLINLFLVLYQDLIKSAKEGEQKKNLAAEKLDALKAVLPKDKQAELDRQKQAAEADWQQLVKSMQDTQ